MEVEDILGCPTETVHISSHAHRPSASVTTPPTNAAAPINAIIESSCADLIDVVLVPGNPGTVAFYLDFMSSLAAVFQDAFPADLVRVHGLSHGM